MDLFKTKTGILVDLADEEENPVSRTVKETQNIDFITGYKINSVLAIRYGLKNITDSLRKITDKPLIYDHQKFGSDDPEISSGKILDYIRDCGIDGIVIFPLSGEKVLESSVIKCNKINLTPIISGDLSYDGYFTDEGGYIDDEIQQRIYIGAASLGVSNFMMSCNRINRIKIYCHNLGNIVGQLKIFFTAIKSKECTNLPDACSQIKQNKAYAIFSYRFSNPEEYIQTLNDFWKSFKAKLE